MRLLNDLYKTTSVSSGDAFAEYDVRLTTSHFIYRVHFPDYPITPGVCIIQVAQELLEDFISCPLRIAKIQNAKFLVGLTPMKEPVRFRIDKVVRMENMVKAQVKVYSSDVVFSKISFLCKTV